MNDLAARIRTLREARGLSQQELARRAGVTQAAITHIEVKRRKPSVRLVARLAEALDIAPDELVAMLLAEAAEAEPALASGGPRQ